MDPERATQRPSGRMGALSQHDFRWFWLSTLAAFLALNILQVTRALLVFQITKSPFALGLVVLSFAGPMFLFSLLGGALADRWPKRTLILASQAVNLIMAMVIGWLVLDGAIAFWHLIASGVVNGIVLSANGPSRQAMITELVDRDGLLGAIALSQSAINVSRVLGPALAGALIPLIGIDGVFFLMAGLSAVSIAFLLRVPARSPSASQQPRPSVVRDMWEGVRFVTRNGVLLSMVALTFTGVLLGFPMQFLMPAYVAEAWGGGARDVGLLLTMAGVGGLVGSVGLAAASGIERKGALLMIGVTAWGVGVVLFAFAPNIWAASAASLVVGLALSVFLTLNITLLQLLSPREMHGRMMSINMMTFGLMPLGVLPVGAAAEVIGTANALGIAGGVLTLLALAYLVLNGPLRRIRA